MGVKIERRKHKRIKCKAFISHDILSDVIIHTDKIHNFSKDGMYFESDQNIYPGDDIYIGIGYHPHLSGDDIQLLFGVEVVWRRELQDSFFRYGFGTKFINSKNPSVKKSDIADALIKKIEMAKFEKYYSQNENLKAENDSRKHPRRRCNQSLFFTYKYQNVKGVVTDISRGGAFVETGSKISLGEGINLVIHGSKNRKGIKLRGWIVRSSPEGVGVSFDRRSSWERRFDLDRRTGQDRRKIGKH